MIRASFSVVFAWVAAVGILAQVAPVFAADPPAKPSVIDDDDDDDATPVQKPSGDPARAGATAPTASIFSPLSVSDWKVEIGLQQRFTSKAGRRGKAEGATGLTYDIVWRDLIFLSSDRGFGANLIDRKTLFGDRDRITAGFSINVDDRDASERSRTQARSADAKRGSSTFVLAFADYSIDRWRLWAEAAHFVANGKGNVVSFGGEYALPLTSKWSTTFASGISFGDRTYMRDNFTIPPLAPSLIRNTTYVSPKAGARDLTVSVNFEYRADAHWRWNTVIGFTQSLAVSQQGAFVKVRSAPFISTGIRYRF
jgi:outer membrane scaffolding protein for murein synthesis (MipA/OmpV family)